MKSLLDENEGLRHEIERIAEVAGYLWEKGWAERNGGNIVVDITEHVDAQMRRLPPLSIPLSIGLHLPHLAGCYFFCKGTGKRMRDLARRPMENGSIIRILPDCEHYEIIAVHPVMPTSELPSHLAVHDKAIADGHTHKATIHTHPIELVAMSHHRPFLQKDVLTRLLWSMIPETKAFCPLGLGVVEYELPGSNVLAEATMQQLEEYDVVLWEKHGVFAKGQDVMDAFDQIDVLSKSAQIYLAARSMGFEPEGMSPAQMQEMSAAFNLPK